jgi:signal transduction histidine kinase
VNTDQRLDILLVEDNPGDAYLIREILRNISYAGITSVENLKAALDHLERHAVDIILLDLSLPDSRGLETVRRVVAQMPRLPIIVLTGLDDETLALEALKAGAQDYMVKGLVESEMLIRAIRYAMERKMVEEELNRHREHLEELVKERTRELEERNAQLHEEIIQRKLAEEEKKGLENQLIQSQKMEALGRFAGGIAHDLNNILYPIIIDAESLLEDTEPGTSVHLTLNQILKAAHRQKDLVKQILFFSRRSEQYFNPIKVAPLIKETIDLLRSSLPSHIKIVHSDHASSDLILGDPTQIQQIIMNLCRNAADAIGARTGTIAVSLAGKVLEPSIVHPDVKAGKYLKLMVKDSGSGMTKEVMDRIFEPFFTTKDPGKGSGMGLAVVHGILKHHGGTITVESEEGKGSTFTVYLPITDEEFRTQTPATDRARSVNEKGKVLLVDDEEIILNSLKNALKRMGYDVVTLKDGLEAYEVFLKAPSDFDLVITDLTMPKLSGIELASKLMDIRSDIPVILCTGFNDVIDEDEAKSMGIRELLLKPASTSELKTAIGRALENKHGTIRLNS